MRTDEEREADNAEFMRKFSKSIDALPTEDVSMEDLIAFLTGTATFYMDEPSDARALLAATAYAVAMRMSDDCDCDGCKARRAANEPVKH